MNDRFIKGFHAQVNDKKMAKQEKQKKSAWFYVAVIVGLILVYSLMTQSGDNVSSENTQFIKGTYTYTWSGNNDVTTLHRPEDKVSIVISGSDNILIITKETEVSKIVLSGMNNQINFCKEGYSIPELTKSGLNNQINIIDC